MGQVLRSFTTDPAQVDCFAGGLAGTVSLISTGPSNYASVADETKVAIMHDFAHCKSQMLLRLWQVFGFWQSLPWAVEASQL
jgi:hypothetical protein